MALNRLAKFGGLSTAHDAPKTGDAHEALTALLAPGLDALFDQFAAYLQTDPVKAATHAKGDYATLKTAVGAHWRSLLSGSSAQEANLRARRVGEAHVRAQLTPDAFIDAYGFYTKALIDQILARSPRESSLVHTLLEALFADMGASFVAFFSGAETRSREGEAAELLRVVDVEMEASNAVAETQAKALRAIVTDLETIIDGLRGGVSLVSDGASTASGSIGAVAAAVEQLHASSQEVGRQANDANALVNDAVVRAEQAERRFAELAACAARVSEIVTLISGISNQTNLLALNATIEAARAGENGRGFAVVANEVKSLSQRTGMATREIATQIAEIETAVRASNAAMHDVRDLIGRISDIAASVAQSSGQQVGAIQEIGESASAAARGAAQLDGSVDLFNGAVTKANAATEKVATQSRQISTLFERLTKRLSMTLKNFADSDQRKFPRSPTKIATTLVHRGQKLSAEILEISQGSALVNGLPAPLDAGATIEADLSGIGPLRARVAAVAEFGQRLQFIEIPPETATELTALMQRLQAKEQALREIVRARAGMIALLFERALDSGQIKEDELFDVNYAPIPGTNPQQYGSRALSFLEANLPEIQEPILALDSAVVFSAAVDRNGYLPVHNKKFSEPQGADPVWNNAHSRNRRIFDDMTGLMAARNRQPILSQTYPRDLGGGKIELIKDISAPILVRGKHWGGLRMGARIA